MAKKKLEKIYMEPHSELTNHYNWCSFTRSLDFKDISFTKILKFYLFETPATNVSHRSKSFKEYGWTGTGIISKLKSTLFKSTIGFENYEPTEIDTLYEKLAEHNLLDQLDLSKELAVFYNRDEPDGELVAMFASIRNALAHGAFDIIFNNDIKYYILENREPNTDEIRARFILKETTLLHWTDTITKGIQN